MRQFRLYLMVQGSLCHILMVAGLKFEDIAKYHYLQVQYSQNTPSACPQTSSTWPLHTHIPIKPKLKRTFNTPLFKHRTLPSSRWNRKIQTLEILIKRTSSFPKIMPQRKTQTPFFLKEFTINLKFGTALRALIEHRTG